MEKDKIYFGKERCLERLRIEQPEIRTTHRCTRDLNHQYVGVNPDSHLCQCGYVWQTVTAEAPE